MVIWVDADACPVVIREILFRAAERTATDVRLVSNHPLPVPPSRYVRSVQVGSGFDVADDLIVSQVSVGDLVITSDIPLADEVIQKGALALSSRGEEFNASTIKARLNMRDFLETMRAGGIQSGGQAPLGQPERQKFANALDRILTRATAARQASSRAP